MTKKRIALLGLVKVAVGKMLAVAGRKLGPVSTVVQLVGLGCGVKAGFEVGAVAGYGAACVALMFAGHAIDR